MAASSDVKALRDIGHLLEDETGAEAHAAKRQTSLDPPDAKRMACGSPGTAIHVTAAVSAATSGSKAAADTTGDEPSHVQRQQQQQQQQQEEHDAQRTQWQDARTASTHSSSSHGAGSMGPPAARRSPSPLSHQVVTTGMDPGRTRGDNAAADHTAAAAAAAPLPSRPWSPFAAGAYATAPEGEEAAGGSVSTASPQTETAQQRPVFSPFLAATAAASAAAAKQQAGPRIAPGSSTASAGSNQQQQQDGVFQPPQPVRPAANPAAASKQGPPTAADVWAQITGGKGAPAPPPHASSSGGGSGGRGSGATGSSPFLQGAGNLLAADRSSSQQVMDRMHSSASLECWLQPSGSLAGPLPGSGSSGGLLSHPSISSTGISAAVPSTGLAGGDGGGGGSSTAVEGHLMSGGGSGGLARGPSAAAAGLERSFSLNRWIRPRDPSSTFSWPTPLVARSLSAEDMEMEVQVLPAVTPEQYPTPDPRQLSPEGGPAAAAAAGSSHAGHEAAAAGSPSSERQFFRKIAAWEQELVDMLGPEVGYEPQSIKAIVGVFRERIRCDRDKNEFKALCDKWTYVTEHPPGSGVKCLAIKAWLRQAPDAPAGQEGADE